MIRTNKSRMRGEAGTTRKYVGLRGDDGTGVRKKHLRQFRRRRCRVVLTGTDGIGVSFHMTLNGADR